MAMMVKDVLQHTNWSVLRDQKRALVAAALNPANPHARELNGILEWINDIQDAAEHEGYEVKWLTEEEE